MIYSYNIMSPKSYKMKLTYSESISAEEKSEKDERYLIDINSASAEDLSQLEGIGKVRAEKIVRFREKHSDFTNINELMDIDGIGLKTFEKIKNYITVR